MDTLEKRLQEIEYRLSTLERLLEKLSGNYVLGAVSELEAAKVETLEAMRRDLGQLLIEYRTEQIGKLGPVRKPPTC